jgi:hypothetical protein
VELHDDHRSLRLSLTAAAHLTLLQEHIDKHRHATLTEADPTSGTGWIGGHIHEIVLPFTRAVPPAPNLVTGPLPLAGNTTATHLPAAPASKGLYAQVFTHPERIDDILRTHLPQLLADLDSDLPWWFARYRSDRETDPFQRRREPIQA